MKRIEDAPKELQQVYGEIWREVSRTSGSTAAYCEHFFLKGFDTAMATGGLPQRPKRTITKLYVSRQDPIMALSSDGHGYEFVSESGTWRKLPDLPQD